MDNALERLKKIDREITLLSHVNALLGWDQETYMPEHAIEERSDQFALVQTLIHERRISPEIGELLAKLGVSDDNLKGDESFSELDRALLREIHRWYTRSIRLPAELVSKIAKKTSVGQATWAEARRRSDFSHFAPVLSELIDLTLEVAERIGYVEHPYDALLDEYEPYMLTSKVASVFAELARDLVPLVRQIGEAPQVDDSFMHQRFPIDRQEQFGKEVLSKINWDFKRGRLDVSAHPFTTSLGNDDVRLTTRYRTDLFQSSVFSTIHEAGHGLYELGFDEAIKGSSLADGTSLGIHESQSRTWENGIGRSLPFWRYFYPRLKELFGDLLGGVDVDSFYRAVNRVAPSHIRVDADEVTYSLHIVLRFELETKIVKKEIRVNDLPEAWREKSRELLGIVPENDADGVLQDIHWSMGGMGYFPTYALGNLYGAQFQRAMRKDIPDLDERVSSGDFQAPLSWLRANIHRHGKAFTASELVKKVTGEELNASYFMDYLRTKYGTIYRL